jgi:hypothetical protein
MKDIKSDIERSLPEIATSVSLTAKALAERTIKEKGFGAVYSTSELPAFWFQGKESTQRGASFIENKIKKDEGMAWRDLREAEGLQTEHVDLTFTGEMFAGMYPDDPVVEGNRVIAPLGHTNKEGQKKMNYNRDRYGDFIGKVLVGDNFDSMVKVATAEVIRIIQRNNL